MWTIYLKFWNVSRCVPDPVGMFLPLQWVWAPVWPSPWPRPTPSVDVDEWNLSGFEQNHRALTSFCEERWPIQPFSHSPPLAKPSLWETHRKTPCNPSLLPIPIDTSCCYFATRTACRNSHGTSTPFQDFLLEKICFQVGVWPKNVLWISSLEIWYWRLVERRQAEIADGGVCEGLMCQWCIKVSHNHRSYGSQHGHHSRATSQASARPA